MSTVQVRRMGAAGEAGRSNRSSLAWIAAFVLLGATPLHAGSITLYNETVTTGRTVSTEDGSIYAGQGYTISPPGAVTFKAYGVIDLKNGFTATQGSSFRAYLIGTESDPDMRYYTVTGTIMLNGGSGAADITLVMYGYNSYGRWVSRTAVTDTQGSFTFDMANGTYSLTEQADSYVFRSGEVGSVQVSDAPLSINPESTALIQTDTRLTYFHHDLFGSSAAQTSDNGGVIMRSVFYPFGDQFSTEGVGERYLFTGKERDTTGLDFFGARYYEPSLGRFTGTDDINGKISEPQSWNRYVYCFNNPYKYVDLNGMWGDQVHYNESLRIAGNYFSPIQSELIARACRYVDSPTGMRGPYPGIGDQRYHFNTGNGTYASADDSRLKLAQQHLINAIKFYNQGSPTFAFMELGTGLHPLQDVFAHTPEYQEYCGFYYHWNPDADDKKITPNRINGTYDATDRYLKIFRDCTVTGSPGMTFDNNEKINVEIHVICPGGEMNDKGECVKQKDIPY